MNQPHLVSVHGGHSGEFCNHAQDSLENIITSYIKKGFAWVGITEHMPPPDDCFLYPDEKEAGLDSEKLYQRFARYISTCRSLQKKYSSSIKILVGFETETYTGYKDFIKKLVNKFEPDYIVGSVHHIRDIPFDMSQEQYDQIALASGGHDGMYCEYFDLQYDMINALRPPVVGHFDLIRLFDPEYCSRLKKPEIWKRILRNLKCISEFDLILDFNMRSLYKGASEPFVSEPILLQALELGIAVIPGDDSHSAETTGLNIEKGIKILAELGFDTRWRIPEFSK
ncbi:histidinol-phosphatase [Desulfonema magnum]|uniref:Histidinol-phosphatase n=1 Tax=Desulfonema magnum TaxID=45655 RepID=A0A975BPM6_9BACT|nr:histidinol-phosphatase [Desulfonema magnum]QTA89043.1 Histidinol phosphate phosphatase, HisJ family [Desulfonema magnum]